MKQLTPAGQATTSLKITHGIPWGSSEMRQNMISLVNAAKKYAPGGASAALDTVLLGAGAARNPVGAAGAAKDSLVAAKNAVMERLKTPTFDRGGKP